MYQLPGRETPLFVLMLATMMVPSLVRLIPWFIIISRLGWVNDLRALIVPGAVSAFGDLLDAAVYLVEYYAGAAGCRPGGWLFRVNDLLPGCRPAA